MRHIITIILIFKATISFCQTKQELDSLTNLLERVSVDDQMYRQGWDSVIQKYAKDSPDTIIAVIKKMNFQDSVNMAIVGNILDKYGWLSKEQTSVTANETLFLVLQHATIQAQLKYLPVMKQAVEDKKTKPSAFALLLDRTNMFQGKLQVYGSQVTYDAGGKIHIFPIEDEKNVNARRKLMGLPSMQEYLKLFNAKLIYILPQTDKYKNKIIIQGSTTDKQTNLSLPNVFIYSNDGKYLTQSDANGFFRIILNSKASTTKLVFKKEHFNVLEFAPDINNKVVTEINPGLTKK